MSDTEATPTSIPLDARIYVPGHDGLVGSAIMRRLHAGGYSNILTRELDELDLTDQAATRAFFQTEKPEYVLLCAAKVGGILANNTYPAEFIQINLAIAANVIHESWRVGVKRLVFLGSSCIYPRDCPQPMREDHLLTGPLEMTNRPYALAKIAGIEMCWAYNRQYGTRYISVMPTNLYGPGDNYNLDTSHVLPALIRKMHEAKESGAPSVTLWGTGTPCREFLYSDDLADAVVHLLSLPEANYERVFGDDAGPPLINIGSGKDQTIRELGELVKEIVGFTGAIEWDPTKPDGTPRKLLDVTRLTQLGWTYRTELKDGIRKAYKEFLRLHA